MNAPVPFEYQIWDSAQCGEYFGVSKETFLRDARHSAGFPKELPKLHNRWPAAEVAKWALGR